MSEFPDVSDSRVIVLLVGLGGAASRGTGAAAAPTPPLVIAWVVAFASVLGERAVAGGGGGLAGEDSVRPACMATDGKSVSPSVRGNDWSPPGTRSRARLVTLLRKSAFFDGWSARLAGSSVNIVGCLRSVLAGGLPTNVSRIGA